MTTYKINVADKLKREIEQAIEDKVDEIVDGEQFSIICDGKAVLGKRAGDRIEIERVIEKVL
ncbi:hypothetical protein P4U99_22970 [Brevibacillus agri]|uniref:hypothetical protein n=1 Tax=Brevibacillus TaxID=55080 RepID=UPI0015627C90|nr:MULTISPECIES: hypothetical protein [Brevibacillus]MBE5394523.1 hypothetical protein [Brevibacillus borstelensis]MED1646014.1 hypothetical protein [Brevibacillus agri]MED1656327.1 hypothetical protein [Brevibacillus agri]MED1689249.1 hypothetical protein [Brevibacillus agri]MED1693772.1 hypothetical protein [Brevibacillus agri]